jgi:hypothetical protein
MAVPFTVLLSAFANPESLGTLAPVQVTCGSNAGWPDESVGSDAYVNVCR